MKKKFVGNLIILLTLNFLIKPFWIFGIDRTVQNMAGAESYGMYFALLNISFIFNIFLDLGITNFNNKNIAQNNHLLNKHFSGIVVMKLMLSLVYLIITLVYAFAFSYSYYQVMLLLVLCFNQFLASFVLYLRSNISGLYMFVTDSILSVLDRLVMIVICSILLWGHITDKPFRIEWFILAQTAAYLITCIIALIIVAKKAAFRKVRWNIPFFIVIFRRSYPFALLVLLMNFYYRIDGVMLERMLDNGAREAGVYAAAFRILDAGFMLAYLFAVLLLPIFSRMIKQKENIEGILKLSFTLITVPAVTIAVISFLYRTEIMSLLYHDHVQESAAVFGVLMMSFTAIAASYIFSTLLTANGNLKILNLIALAGMCANISLNFILIPRLGAQGSAFACFATQFLVLFLQLYFMVKQFNMKPNFRYLMALLVFVAGLIFLALVFSLLDVSWLLKVVATIAMAISLALAVRLFNIKDIRKISFKEL
jgi:O-antigen/teichoic acid export membrane protein